MNLNSLLLNAYKKSSKTQSNDDSAESDNDVFVKIGKKDSSAAAPKNQVRTSRMWSGRDRRLLRGL